VKTLVLSILGAGTFVVFNYYLINSYNQPKTIPEPYRTGLYLACITADNTATACLCIEEQVAESGMFNPEDLSPEAIEKMNTAFEQALKECGHPEYQDK
jgi:hypothetical protein